MANQAFVDSLIQEIIHPGIERLMETRYFSELREGKLSVRRLQGWALQHFLHNIALVKGFTVCMVKNTHNDDLYNIYLQQFNEEQYHPELAKRFGLALGLQDKDFDEVTPIFECLMHTSKTIHGMVMCSPAENRASALVNESMVCRYSEEFNTYLRKNYSLEDKALQFFTVHMTADQEHTKIASDVVAQLVKSDKDEQLVREGVQHMVRLKIEKFNGIYEAYN